MGEDQGYEDLRTEDEIESIMAEGGGAVVLDFWSETCGPCMAMADDFAHVAGQFDSNEVRFCKVNVTEYGNLAAPFKIRSVPTILFVHDGKIVDAVVGKMSAEQLGSKAEWLLKKSNRKGLLSRIFG
ncbi:MAG: thioredoxin domain-containing protein [Myxococcota bacterium]